MAAEVTLPEWLAEVWREWRRAARSGWLSVNFKRGVETQAKERRLHFAPPLPAGHAKTAPRCPACGEIMTSRDAGTMWVCRCGRKMTRAQAEGR